MTRRASLLALGWLACACSETIPSQVIVQLYVDPELASTATELTVTIENDEHETVLQRTKQLDGASGRIARIPLIPKGGDPTRRFVVRAEISDGTSALGRIEARAGYQDGELRSLNLWFSGDCSGQTDCGEGKSCHRGTCRGACYDTLPADATQPSEPSCKECEKCLARCEATDGDPCGCSGDSCQGSDCVARDKLRFVGAGWTHSCAVLASNQVYCWGTTDGLGAGWASASPLQIGAVGSLWLAVNTHACALSPETRQCWGSNDDGELGDGAGAATTPVSVANTAPQFLSLDLGSNHSCGVSLGHEIYCWGANDQGQLGIGAVYPKGTVTAAPQLVGAGYDQVSTGGDHSCAIELGGGLRCWGKNFSGQVGIEAMAQITSPAEPGCDDPSSPTCFHDWDKVGTGGWLTCAIRKNGHMYCWGSNTHHEGGSGPPFEDSPELRRVGADITWAQVDGGFRHACGLDKQNRLYCWGSNAERQVGVPGAGTDYVDGPELVESDTHQGFTNISLGQFHTCAIREDRTLWCWGRNVEGQIGSGPASENPAVRPTRVCFPP